MRNDYNKFNYCFRCNDKGLPHPKTVLRCRFCNQKLRTVARKKHQKYKGKVECNEIPTILVKI